MKRTRLRPVSKKTRTVRWPVLTALRAHVLARAQTRCEHCGVQRRLEIHHVRKRSAGGADHPDNAIALCAGLLSCHAWTDAPYSGRKGRLVITPLGQERFRRVVIWAPDKWAARA